MAFGGNCRIERRHIDQPRRLGAEDKRIVRDAFAVHLGVNGQFADTREALARIRIDATIE